ncbi:MAG: SDR family NAD(P)-dependent oxidoreductase [Nostoc sp.]|uniref:SDR family NAD(P)-dependent oxidoreductase n=1 Tax=Nostoc sp. TaxID=1180 RepID=UPI002FF76A8F
MAGKLNGKVAVITGASSGIGEATAIALAAEGAKIVLAARRVEKLEALAKQITDGSGQALPIAADVTDDAQIRELVEKTQSHFGGIDILINNAGVMLVGPVEGADISDWQRMIDIDLLGLMKTTHAVLPILKAQGGGHIVNIASVAGRIPIPNYAVYNAVKFGVVAFSEALRKEVIKDKIRITVIEPGAVATELASQISNPEARQQVDAFYNSVEPLQKEDIAAAIAYAVTQPAHVSVNEILIRPSNQEM